MIGSIVETEDTKVHSEPGRQGLAKPGDVVFPPPEEAGWFIMTKHRPSWRSASEVPRLVPNVG